MIYFNSDYMEGAHPEILKRLTEINFDKNPGYGHDDYCQSAKEKIRAACKAPNATVRFLVGGTQTNSIVIDAMLSHNEGIISAETGHICNHEAGAVEACGHKVILLEGKEGKLSALTVATYLREFFSVGYGYEHLVVPKAVYISQSTEYGTIYTHSELQDLREVCDRYGLYLFMDGARLGYALAARHNNLWLPDIARLCDAFYIGGTKVGALFGEAVVITNPNIKLTLGYIKNRGALLAKGWLLGVQFDTLFTDDLYMKIAKNGVEKAIRLRNAIEAKGYPIYLESPTNQQFVVVENSKLSELSKKIGFNPQEAVGKNHTVIRFATSWATTDEQIDKLIALL
ncbi:MAG: low specificity L-threonine aldolase [Muribaculaceae bacterium]|nr:low specificity L-threonine aldolase [Muribaculaceae bacterium]